MTAAVILLTTAPVDAAEALARQLVDSGAAACVNVLPPMVSIYRWKGDIQREAECQLVIKTSATALEAAQRVLRTHHPYELPECLVIRVDDGDPAYLAWLAGPMKQ